jgi:hypothetical protein
MVKSINANGLYLLEHVPDVFDGDMVLFSAKRYESWRSQWRGPLVRMAI